MKACIILLTLSFLTGKTTLAKILLRIIDFDEGELSINRVDLRSLDPVEYHRHITAVFQNFSKFNFTVQENVGLGYVNKLSCNKAVETAVHLAEADSLVSSLPLGLQTTLESPGFDSMPHYAGSSHSQSLHHGLSGGEVSF